MYNTKNDNPVILSPEQRMQVYRWCAVNCDKMERGHIVGITVLSGLFESVTYYLDASHVPFECVQKMFPEINAMMVNEYGEKGKLMSKIHFLEAMKQVQNILDNKDIL